MKKLLLVAISFLILITGCASSNNVMKGYQGIKGKTINFETKNYTEMVNDMIEKKPGVYYLGYPECPWCQSLIPVLNEVLIENDLKAMYLNTSSAEFKDNTLLTERFLKSRESFPAGVENEGYVPFVLVIGKDGSLQGHTGTTPDVTDPKKPMTEDQVRFLKTRLSYLFESLD